MRQILFDTETTGADFSSENVATGHRVIEIGCVELINRHLTGNNFHCYFNPHQDISPEAEKVHGIKLSFLQDKPDFADKMDELLAYLDGADELIAHNAPFDICFLQQEFRLADSSLDLQKRYKIVDTLQLARKQFPGQRHSLDALCRRFSISLQQRQDEGHGALLDAQLLAHVYLNLTGGQAKLGFADVLVEKEQQVKEDHATGSSYSWVRAKLSPDEEKLHADYMDKIKI